MLHQLMRENPKALGLLGSLLVINIVVWIATLATFHDSGALLATSLLAWCYGLRHAVDADHIAAIDNVTRKMMQEGRKPYAVGAWFSLGHSTIVILASLAIAFTATAFQSKMGWFHDVGGVIGTSVSAGFLLLMALVNFIILRSVWNNFQQIKRGESLIVDEVNTIPQGGLLGKIFGWSFRLVHRDWQMYLVGFLFGLGFDTATEVGLLGISAAGASQGMSIWSIMLFPALFTCGMAFIDSLDNVIMVGAYGWAFNKPQRKLYYNMTITASSVLVALLIGGIEALGLLADQLDLHTGIWHFIEQVNDNLGNAGFIVVGLFIACWGISIINYRLKNYDALNVAS